MSQALLLLPSIPSTYTNCTAAEASGHSNAVCSIAAKHAYFNAAYQVGKEAQNSQQSLARQSTPASHTCTPQQPTAQPTASSQVSFQKRTCAALSRCRTSR